MNKQTDWYIYHGKQSNGKGNKKELPTAPPWRDFSKNESLREQRGKTFQPRDKEIEMVNAALYLRRPLLITGLPGTGKSSLAFAVAEEMGWGEVLVWPITSRAQLKDGLYSYDAIGRLQDSNFSERNNPPARRGLSRFLFEGVSEENNNDPMRIEKYIRLGALGTAFATSARNQPRVLLIDEIDKGDIDLPNDLLNIFEEGEFLIPELARQQTGKVEVRTADKDDNVFATVDNGHVICQEFPFVILTSNGERELPPAFLRRCLRLDITPPTGDHFRNIVRAHFTQLPDGKPLPPNVEAYIDLVERQYRENKVYVPTDQLLNAVYLVLNEVDLETVTDTKKLSEEILRTIYS